MQKVDFKLISTYFIISRESLATIAGTATESLIRTLNDFRSEKLIDIKDGSITFINQKKPEHIVN